MAHAKPEQVAKMKQEMTHLNGTVSGDRSTVTLAAGNNAVEFKRSQGS